MCMISRNLKKEYKNGKLYLTGPMLIADVPNANGIVYSKQVIEKMYDEYQQRNAPLFGTTEVTRSYKVCLNDVVAKTTSVAINEDCFEATVEVLPTVPGKAFEEIVLNGKTIPYGFNTHVMGSVDEKTNTVKDDAIIYGFTIVPVEMLT